MKAWAKENDINSSKDRTLNSLSIILLVAFHLQVLDIFFTFNSLYVEVSFSGFKLTIIMRIKQISSLFCFF